MEITHNLSLEGVLLVQTAEFGSTGKLSFLFYLQLASCSLRLTTCSVRTSICSS